MSRKEEIGLFHTQDKEAFIQDTTKKVIAELTQKDKDFLLTHPDPSEHHFGLGLYIRNQYIHGKKLGFLYAFADDLSTEIVEMVIKTLQKESKNKE